MIEKSNNYGPDIFYCIEHIFQPKEGFTAVNLTLSTFPCTISRSSLLGGGVNSSPGQHAIALSSMGVRMAGNNLNFGKASSSQICQ